MPGRSINLSGTSEPSHTTQRITILGVGNILLTDEGVGVRVVEHLNRYYLFGDNVRLVDGGVLGVGLMGVVSDCDVLIVVDAVQNQNPPGTLYRLEGEQVPRRVLAKQSMHQLDLPEVLALCEAIDVFPQVVVLGVEPQDISTMDVILTPAIAAKLEPLAGMVLAELDRLQAAYRLKAAPSGMSV